jgi:hypothetical protein
MNRTCLACHQRDADTLPEYPALCIPCLERVGENIEPGASVICVNDDGCSGIVERLTDEMLAIVRTRDGGKAWVPQVDLVRVVEIQTNS